MKLKKNKINIVVFFVVLSGCIFRTIEIKTTKAGHIVHSLLDRVSDELQDKYQMIDYGTSIAMPEGVLNKLGLCFKIYRVVTIEEARSIVVDCTLKLLNEVNQDPAVRPLMREYPFTLDNITIALFMFQSDGRVVFYPDICIADSNRGFVGYKTKVPKKEYGYYSESRESFAEAQKILQEQASSQKSIDLKQ